MDPCPFVSDGAEGVFLQSVETLLLAEASKISVLSQHVYCHTPAPAKALCGWRSTSGLLYFAALSSSFKPSALGSQRTQVMPSLLGCIPKETDGHASVRARLHALEEQVVQPNFALVDWRARQRAPTHWRTRPEQPQNLPLRCQTRHPATSGMNAIVYPCDH